ncbi:MAG: hypothetical protein Q9168_006070 [Polycauliona sp. 1 TL-2023]
MTAIPDLVRLSKLETRIHPEYIQHVRYTSSSTTSRNRVRKEEKWRRVKELGRGAFGTVWLEHCIEGDDKGKARAVKGIRKLESSNYNRELEAVALFSHKDVPGPAVSHCFVESFGWFDGPDDIFISMEYLKHGDLHGYLGSPLPEDQSRNIVLQLLEGLQFMHDFDFTHRDLKPAVGPSKSDWWVKIADFGISKRASDGLTELRTKIGTPAFAAPEVLGFCPLDEDSSDAYTNAVDVWSLGVIAFFILTGELIFEEPRRLSREKIIPSLLPLLDTSEPEPSASWSTSDSIPDRETVNHASKSTKKPVPVRLEEAQSSFTEVIHPIIWKLKATRKYETTGGAVFSPDGEWFAIGSEGRIRLCSTTTQAQRSLPRRSQLIQSIALSPDGRQIASGSDGGILRLWDVDTGVPLRTLDEQALFPVYSIAFSPDGKTIASGSKDTLVKLRVVATGALLHMLHGHLQCCYAVAFSPDGKYIASGSGDGTLRLWDVARGALLRRLKGHYESIYAVAFSPDGKQIASGSQDETIRLWDAATGAPLHMLKGHRNRVNSVAFSPDGKQIASGSYDETTRLWDVETQVECYRLEQGMEVDCVTFSPNGKIIMCTSEKGKALKLWEATTETVSLAKECEGLPLTVRGHIPKQEEENEPVGDWVHAASSKGSDSNPKQPPAKARTQAPIQEKTAKGFFKKLFS